MKLYEINQELDNCFDPETGEILDEEAFEALSEERDAKLEGVACIIKNRDALIESIKNEERRLKDRRLTLEKQNEGTKAFLDLQLDGRKFETAKVRCSYRHIKAVEIADESLVPDQFVKVEEKRAPDKMAIKAAIIDGNQVPGCNLRETNSLSIK